MADPVAPTVRTASWLRAAVDQRVREAARLVPEPGVVTTLVVPLCDRPPDVDYERWDRTCDRCGVYVPPSRDVICGLQQSPLADRTGRHRLTVHVMFGLCGPCSTSEVAA